MAVGWEAVNLAAYSMQCITISGPGLMHAQLSLRAHLTDNDDTILCRR